MSRNEERLSAPQLEIPSEQIVRTNKPPSEVNMDWYTPSTMVVELPSEGKFYPDNHPLHNKSYLEIKHMTAKEEEYLTNKDLIKKGLALDRVIASMLIDKSIDVDSLLVGDKAAVLIAARISGFEAAYNLKTACRACGSVNEISYNLEERKNTEILDEYKGAKRMPHGGFTLELPKSGVTVECKLLNGFDQNYLHEQNEMKKKNKFQETPMLDMLKRIIISVNGNENRGMINSFVENGLPTIDSRFLKLVYSKMNPTVDMEFIFQCDKCEYYNQLEVPMTTDFFWPTTE